MKNLLVPISMGVLCVSFTVIPPSAQHSAGPVASPAVHPSTTTISTADNLYNSIELGEHGLSREAFTYAWQGYQYLVESGKLNRTAYLTICDFSQSSKQKRLYIIDLDKNELVINTWVAHGKNSGGEYATQFSNTAESLQSSLGFYTTSTTYLGKHGLSLRLNGVEPGFNDRAMERTIVIHGASYVDAARLKAGMYMGRSWGCPAVPQKESAGIINTIKNGTCFFIYHPERNYLLHSKILNPALSAAAKQTVND
ncbi:MAG: murein L,D-transpeptidase catalytic domain family protein [Chitinophagaceae bacterium]